MTHLVALVLASGLTAGASPVVDASTAGVSGDAPHGLVTPAPPHDRPASAAGEPKKERRKKAKATKKKTKSGRKKAKTKKAKTKKKRPEPEPDHEEDWEPGE